MWYTQTGHPLVAIEVRFPADHAKRIWSCLHLSYFTKDSFVSRSVVVWHVKEKHPEVDAVEWYPPPHRKGPCTVDNIMAQKGAVKEAVRPVESRLQPDAKRDTNDVKCPIFVKMCNDLFPLAPSATPNQYLPRDVSWRHTACVPFGLR